jgi:hypothetical protein
LGCTRPSNVFVKPALANSLLPTNIIRLILFIGRSLEVGIYSFSRRAIFRIVFFLEVVSEFFFDLLSGDRSGAIACR